MCRQISLCHKVNKGRYRFLMIWFFCKACKTSVQNKLWVPEAYWKYWALASCSGWSSLQLFVQLGLVIDKSPVINCFTMFIQMHHAAARLRCLVWILLFMLLCVVFVFCRCLVRASNTEQCLGWAQYSWPNYSIRYWMYMMRDARGAVCFYILVWSDPRMAEDTGDPGQEPTQTDVTCIVP